MLSKSLLVACIWFSNSIVQGQFINDANCTVDETDVPELQSGINNYVIDMLGTMQFPFAIGQCTAINVINTGRWYKYQCDMDSSLGISTVTKTEYFDDQCATDGIIVETFNETDIVDGQQGAFECSGYNTYTRTTWSLDPDCVDGVVIYVALGACTNFGGGSQINFFCSANETIGQIFNFGDQMPTSTFLPSTTFFPNATFPSLLNATLPSLLNATLPSLLNATLPSLLNATLPSLLNATFPSLLNATLPSLLSTTSLFNATFPSFLNATFPSLLNATFPMLNMSTTEFVAMMCADEAFCDRWIFTRQCQPLARVPIAGTQTIIYGHMDECSTNIESTMIETTDLTVIPTGLSSTAPEVTEPTTPTVSSSTSTSTTGTASTSTTESTSGAIRPSLVFTVGMLFSFFFLVSV